MNDFSKTLHAVVRGRVQGVFFRVSTRDEARRLGISGWVRNLPDGTVEVYAGGTESNLMTLLEWLHSGPPGAKVTEVDASWNVSGEPVPPGFDITG